MPERLNQAFVSACEPVECPEDRILQGFTAGMPRIADNDELRVGPGAGEFPGGSERGAYVEAAVDEDAWNAG